MQISPPLRVAHSYTQHLAFPAQQVFPLLCPVRESEWIETWSPSLVLTASGIAELHCTFVTGTGAEQATWTVTRYEAPHVIEFVRVGPGAAVTHIDIVVREAGSSACTADITYRITALPGGEPIVDAFGEAQFRAFMELWQTRLEHYLGTGEMLRGTATSPA